MIILPGVGSPPALLVGLSLDIAALAASMANRSQMFNLQVATVSASAIRCIYSFENEYSVLTAINMFNSLNKLLS